MRSGLPFLIASGGIALLLTGCAPVGYAGCEPAGCVYPQPPRQRVNVVYVTPHPVVSPAGAGDLPFEDPSADYTRRSVTISPGAGNAQAANLALQTATPYPRHAYDTNIPGNGAVMQRTMTEFETGKRETATAKRMLDSNSGGGSTNQINISTGGSGGSQ